jgi:acyl carrier protein
VAIVVSDVWARAEPSQCMTVALIIGSADSHPQNALHVVMRAASEDAPPPDHDHPAEAAGGDESKPEGPLFRLAVASSLLASRDGCFGRDLLSVAGPTDVEWTIDSAGRWSCYCPSSGHWFHIRVEDTSSSNTSAAELKRAVAILEETTGYDISERLTPDRTTPALAIDSIVAAEFVIRFETTFCTPFPIEQLLDRPAPDELRERMRRCLAEARPYDTFTPIGPLRTEVCVL